MNCWVTESSHVDVIPFHLSIASVHVWAHVWAHILLQYIQYVWAHILLQYIQYKLLTILLQYTQCVWAHVLLRASTEYPGLSLTHSWPWCPPSGHRHQSRWRRCTRRSLLGVEGWPGSPGTHRPTPGLLWAKHTREGGEEMVHRNAAHSGDCPRCIYCLNIKSGK